MKGKINMRMKLQIQLNASDRLMAAARGSWRKISPTTMKGMGPRDEHKHTDHVTASISNSLLLHSTLFLLTQNALIIPSHSLCCTKEFSNITSQLSFFPKENYLNSLDSACWFFASSVIKLSCWTWKMLCRIKTKHTTPVCEELQTQTETSIL